MDETTFPSRTSARERAMAVGLAILLIGAELSVPLYTEGQGKDTGSPAPRLACEEPPPRAPSSGGGWSDIELRAPTQCFRLVATRRDPSGVSPATGFVLEAARALGVDEVRAGLSVSPRTRFDVEELPLASASAETGNPAARFRITPARALAPGATYRFAWREQAGARAVQRWAFSVQASLRVVQTLPRDEATDVPLNIGVELTFSHEGVAGVEENFSIDPSVEGAFETHKRTTVFVPESLAARTLYTVRLKKGVRIEGARQTLKEDHVFRFETGSGDHEGEAPGPRGPAIAFTRDVWEMRTAEPPVLGVMDQGGESAQPTAAAFTVFRYPDIDAFLRALDARAEVPSWSEHGRTRFRYDRSGLREAVSFEQKPTQVGEYGDAYIRFPAAVAPGFYLVEADAGGIAQTLLEVTDVSSYIAVSGRETLLWANDLASKSALAGARVEIAGTRSAYTTGTDGTVRFATPPGLLSLQPSTFGEETDAAGNLVVRARDGRTAVVPLSDIFRDFQSYSFREYTYRGDPSPYWRFLHTDRRLYRTTDSVHFWGLVRSRVEPLRDRTVVVELVNYDYSDVGEGDRKVLGRASVPTTARGTFIGDFDFSEATPGYYEIEARIGDRVFSSTGVQVEDFVRPAYKLDVVPSKRAVYAGERVTFGVDAAFFEGSPVPGLALVYDGTVKGRVVTDARGRASLAATAPRDDSGLNVFLAPPRAEEGQITAGAWVSVYGSALEVDARGVQDEDSASVTGTVYRLDLERINIGRSEDPRAGVASGQPLTATVTEVSYRKVKTGTEYDFIGKRTYATYRYDRRTRDAGTYRAVTDASGSFRVTFPARSHHTYEVALRSTDGAGRALHETVYVDTLGGFRFDDETGCSGIGAPYLDSPTRTAYAVGDRVSLSLLRCGKPLPAGGANTYLFFRAQAGIRDHVITASPRFAFPFADRDAPNVDVVAVRFTGFTYEETPSPYTASLDPDTRKLQVQVAATRARHEPGNTARLRIRVTDPLGDPVRAEVLVGAVDEALYRLEGQTFFEELDILSQLYEYVSNGILRTHASHLFPQEYGGPESGGEGDARRDFRDVPLFRRVETGADGTAELTFKVPANLTSWRVSALAVTDQLFAGTGTTLVPVGLPMFVDIALNDTYLTGDRPALRARAFGSELRSGDAVTFSVAVPGLFRGVLRATGRAFEPVDVALPPLKEGNYEMTVRARTAARSDAVVRPFSVVASRLLKTTAAFAEVRPGEDVAIDGSSERTTRLVLTDYNRGRFYPMLQRLVWTYGDRVDQMLARNMAQDLLRTQFHEEPFRPPVPFEAQDYQTSEGGIAIFPFADDDLTLSARMAAIAADQFNKRDLATYFQAIRDDPEETRERAIIAIYGLAALDERVLLEVQAAAVTPNLSAREQLFVGLAAAELGDEETASRLYRDVVDRYGQERGATVRLLVGDLDDTLEASSLGAILGEMLRDEFAPRLFAFTSTDETRDILLGLEQISYLRLALPSMPAEPVRVRYTIGGARPERSLGHGRAIALTLSPSELKELDLEVVQGTLGLASSFLAPFDPGGVKADPSLSVERSYPGQRGNAVTVAEGSLVRVTLSYRMPSTAASGCYQITDLLPSGLRPVTGEFVRALEGDDGESGYVWPYDVAGQRVSFCVWRDGKERSIVYYARPIGTGTFTAEPALMQSQQVAGSLTFTPSLGVTIR